MKKIIFFLILGIFLLPLLPAPLESLGTFERSQCMNISQTCATCSYVNISSVSTNNNSNILSNVEMEDFGNGEWRYEFCNTTSITRYDVKGMGDVNSVDTSFAVYFYVTNSGGTIDEGASSILIMAIVFMLIVGSICLFGFFRRDQHFQTKWTLFLVSFIFFLAGANLISTLIGDTLANPKVVAFFGSFMSISFILFWFAFGLLAVMWFLTMLESILFRKKQKNLMKYGEMHG